MKTHYDAIIIVPLAEEFEECVQAFEILGEENQGDQIRLRARPPGTAISALLVQQGDMGKAEAVRARLAQSVAALTDASPALDPARLHQEAILIAAKADIREELDRLVSHVEQARKMLSDGGPAGRRLDFLSQELNRESNTLTAKSNDVELTNIGLSLKSTVEQFREQVQNLE